MIFFVAKMREAFALQKLLTFFQQKYWQISDINILNFNDTLTNDIVSFEQPGPDYLEGTPSPKKQTGSNKCVSIGKTGSKNMAVYPYTVTQRSR